MAQAVPRKIPQPFRLDSPIEPVLIVLQRLSGQRFRCDVLVVRFAGPVRTPTMNTNKTKNSIAFI